ncbi:hypothetical protein HanXRQr2_Chr10g0419991 [Helianthus annuus]|uniref:Uncharacterized protein n=1 Tax=Helianthus annuus TaxID=4232 RepID=A0A9K3N2K0_HELAN|nr:hypothetical protein HanXRQr2_Chr10g0419991 [Helianthus annuus]KAJ0882128.1 hypothetical protein HanPSC8_Chr10g0406081 [Helianthus annuus]
MNRHHSSRFTQYIFHPFSCRRKIDVAGDREDDRSSTELHSVPVAVYHPPNLSFHLF